MKVVLATDKFKGSLTAAEVAGALTRGLRRAAPDVDVVRVPVADGGDGTLDAFVEAMFARHPVTVSGPTGERVRTAYARRGDVAVVELADASGLARLGAGPAPLHATTQGTGEVVLAAIRAGCREVVIGLGGTGLPAASASSAPRRSTSARCATWARPSHSPPTWTTRCWDPRERPRRTAPRRAPRPRTSPCSSRR